MNAADLITDAELYSVIATFSEKFCSLEEARESSLFVSQEITEVEESLGIPATDSVEHLLQNGVLEKVYAPEGHRLKMETQDPNLELGREVLEKVRNDYSGSYAEFIQNAEKTELEDLPDIVYARARAQ